jgi:hypothetical protein
MNRENLQRMADYIRTVPKEKFHMGEYRKGSWKKHQCGSVGCVIGHCTILDKIENISLTIGLGIDFTAWSEKFTGLIAWSSEWDWCFHAVWKHTDNTPTGAADRIEWLLNHGLPEDWYEQIIGENPLIYKQQS